MELSWSREQLAAIGLTGRSLLVSAAAGSGKTTVLIGRIMRMLFSPEDPVDLDQILIVTFTRSAAAKMKEDLREALTDLLKKDPGNERAQRQLVLLGCADVTTIDSFCLRVVEENTEVLDIDPAFRIADEGELKLLSEDVLDALFEEKYAEGSPGFYGLVERYAPRRDEDLRKILTRLHDFASSHAWPHRWYGAYCASFDAEGTPAWLSWLQDNLTDRLYSLKHSLERMAEICNAQEDGIAVGPVKYLPAVLSDLDQVSSALAKEDFFATLQVIGNYEAERLTSAKGKTEDPALRAAVKDRRDKIKKALNGISERYGSLTRERAEHERIMLAGPMQALLSLAEEYGDRLAAAKREKAVVDFNDIEHLALQVLCDDTADGAVRTERARMIAGRYREVMVDEYQDVTQLQDTLLRAVSTEEDGRPDLFMVGDVKQSIYKFRQARPELFMEKVDTFTKEDSPHQKIDLHKNYRSRPEILSYVNHLFTQVMVRTLGGIDYDEDAAFDLGEEPPVIDPAYRTELLLADAEEEKDAGMRIPHLLQVSEEIKRLVKSGLVVRGDDGERPVRYGDIVLLMRATKGKAEEAVEVLLRDGVPARAQTKTGYFSAWEVRVALAWLAAVENPLDDAAMAAVLHSTHVGFSAEDLANLVADYRKVPGSPASPDLYHALVYRARETGDGRCGRFLEEFDALRALSETAPVYEVLERVLAVTGLYDAAAVMPGGAVRRANLDMLITRAVDFSRTSYHGLYQFLRYIDRLQKYSVDYAEGQPAEEAGNEVRVMSIHASKGLQFPVVFGVDLDKKFNTMDSKAAVIPHAELGIGGDILDPVRRSREKTACRAVIADALTQDMVGEELRLLYVALTRAKDKMYLVGSVKDPETVCLSVGKSAAGPLPRTMTDLLNAKTLLDFVLMGMEASGSHLSVRVLRGEDEEEGAENHPRSVAAAAARLKQRFEAPQEILDGLTQAFDYAYPALPPLPGKVSVSEAKRRWEAEFGEDETPAGNLAPETEEAPQAPSLPAFLRGETGPGAAQRGTDVHKVLELWDYARGTDDAEIAAQIEDIAARIRRDLDTETVQKMITGFLHSSLGGRVRAAALDGRLRREGQFMIGFPQSAVLPGGSEDETVLLQGTIDAWLEEEDGLVLIDYKTDRLPAGGREELRRRHMRQMELYRAALARLAEKPVRECYLFALSLGEALNMDE
ncbi:MAG: helicase-exonuclease AddAB subunit AddA [Lachnospiraceae bacterium]|nr:helicase-exonuclease AddAB subunit AddA [Lachnospiraceae bacterium]